MSGKSVKGRMGFQNILTDKQREEIMRYKPVHGTKRVRKADDIAKEYGVSGSTIRHLWCR